MVNRVWCCGYFTDLTGFYEFSGAGCQYESHYSWLMNVLILSVTGVMYVALSVVMVILYFLYERKRCWLYFGSVALIIAGNSGFVDFWIIF